VWLKRMERFWQKENPPSFDNKGITHDGFVTDKQ
jgi:hypothetical protein